MPIKLGPTGSSSGQELFETISAKGTKRVPFDRWLLSRYGLNIHDLETSTSTSLGLEYRRSVLAERLGPVAVDPEDPEWKKTSAMVTHARQKAGKRANADGTYNRVLSPLENVLWTGRTRRKT